MNTLQSALVMTNVMVRGPRGTQLDDFSMTVERGTFHGLLGSAGSGKSAVAALAMGLKAPNAGIVSVLGENPMPRDASLLKRIGFAAQVPSFFPRTTVREHLRTVAGVYGATDRKVSVLIEALLLDEWVDSRVERLAPGERQRLAIASAVVHQPELLILDEPSGELDVAARLNLVSILRSSNVAGTSTLYITRHLDELEKLCDSVTVISKGTDIAQYSAKSGQTAGSRDSFHTGTPENVDSHGSARRGFGVANTHTMSGAVGR